MIKKEIGQNNEKELGHEGSYDTTHRQLYRNKSGNIL